MAYSVQIKGLKEFKKFLKKAPQELQDEVKEEFDVTARGLVADMKRDAPVNVGRLSNSISYKKSRGLSVEVVAQSAYAPYMEWGTKGNAKVPADVSAYASTFRGPTGISDTDPLIALTAWVKRKGLAATFSVKTQKRSGRNKGEASRERTIAWLIFRKIRKFGVKPHPFFFHTKSGESRAEKAKVSLIQRLQNIGSRL